MSANISQHDMIASSGKCIAASRSAVAACSLSVAMHAILLSMLGLIHFVQKFDQYLTVSSVRDEFVDLVEPKFDTAITEAVGGEVQTYTAQHAYVTHTESFEATSLGSKNSIPEIEKTIEAKLGVVHPSFDELPHPSRSDVLAKVATTGATEHAAGVEGAVDRLAWEIANSLREKKTLVIWLFDVSPSLSARREKIAERVENVYKQLNQLNVGADTALKSAVSVFGADCTIVTKSPVDEASELVSNVRSIKSDLSGDENTFSAVLKVAKHFLPFRTEQHRDVMIVIVTDEEGSDPEHLEQAIVFCKRYGIRCYCVGDSAPFGRKTVEAPFQMEDGERVIGIMQKGPESKFAELLRLGYWGTHSHDLEDISSGFGPYGLTRLCTESNGLFFVTDNGRGQHRFDPAVMRNYLPDYRPIAVLEREIQQNKAKFALIESCLWVDREAQNRKVLNIAMPRLDFHAETDTLLRRELSEAQKPIAELDAGLDILLGRLEQGEKDRLKLKEPRWRASYDLAMGRTLALKTRAFGYNSMLAEMKVNPKKFEKNGNNLWNLIPAKEITARIEVKKMASKSTEYLTRVISEHPGTPWALLAERENAAPLGWEWKESHYTPAPVVASGPTKPSPKFIDNDSTNPKTKPQKSAPVEIRRREI